MKLQEYQAKDILEKFGLPITKGRVAQTPEEVLAIAREIGFPVVIKAQVLVGGRGKAGGVKIARSEKEAIELATQILNLKIKGLPAKKVLVAKALEFEKEYYLGIIVDRASKSNVLMFSEEGGVEIEEVAKTKPERIVKIKLTHPLSPSLTCPERSRGIKRGGGKLFAGGGELVAIAENLSKAYLASDATLAEINPLVITKEGKFIALDAKIVIDDNALFRHPDLAGFQEEAEEDPIEAEAHRRKMAYVRLPGNVGIIGNGAGLVMTTMDEVKRAGGKPASFLDLGGGAKASVVRSALEILLLDPNIKGIFFNVFGGITRCDEVAKGIVESLKTLKINLPIVVRLTGTKGEEGKAILEQTNLKTAASMQEGAQKIVALINKNK